MLRVVDHAWKDHLLALDHLKEGIGLRGYGQRDPLNEYKRESFELFQAMKERIEDDILKTLFRFEPITEEQMDEQRRRAQPRPRARASELSRRRRQAVAEAAGRSPPSRRPSYAGRQGRPQRPLPLRLGQEVQEVPRRRVAGGHLVAAEGTAGKIASPPVHARAYPPSSSSFRIPGDRMPWDRAPASPSPSTTS